nr:hypothetical protein CFP56_15870 [Quercus suber]
MEDGIGNLGLLPREGSTFLEKFRGEGSKIIGISVFEGQPNINGNFFHTLGEPDAAQEKGDVMGDGNGNLELSPRPSLLSQKSPGMRVVKCGLRIWGVGTVVRTWDRNFLGFPLEVVVSKVEACQKSLIHWSRNSFCHVKREIMEEKKLLKVVEGEAAKGRQVDRFLKIKSEIVDLLCLDEKVWQ